MKVIYKSILDELLALSETAQTEYRTVEKVELTGREWDEMCREIVDTGWTESWIDSELIIYGIRIIKQKPLYVNGEVIK